MEGSCASEVDGGREPTHRPRYGRPATTTEIVSSEIDGESVAEPPAVPVEIDVELEVLGVDDDGADVRIASTGAQLAEGADLDEQLAATIEAQLDAATAFDAEYRVDDRGQATDLRVALGVPGLDEFGDQLSGFAAVLPDEPVGVGASWTVSQAIDIGIGVRITQTTTSELVERDGDRVRIRSTVTGAGEPGPLDLPDAPDGFTIEVIAVGLDGVSEVGIDLTSPFPTDGTADVLVEQDLEVDDGGRVERRRQVVETRASFGAS
jgi:hypothetical protein